MSSKSGSVNISIMGRDYQISCPPEEEESLRKSARYLNQQMDQVKSRGSSLGFEKIAVMTALNITHELLRQNNDVTVIEHDSQREIKHIENKIESVLHASRQIEI